MKKRVRTLIFLAVFMLCAAGTAGLSGAEPENTAQTDETGDSASDNGLSSLRIAQALLSPEFSPEQLTYTATVPHDVTRIALTAETRSGQAKKVINGTGDLAVGENTVTITVTAQDGSVREYRVTVIREEAEGGETTSPEETESEPVTESSEEPEETPAVTQTGEPEETPALTQTGEPEETPAVTQTGEPAETPALTQTEGAAETPAVLQTEEPAETQAGAPGGFQTVADSQKTGDGRLFGMNPLVLILAAVSLLLLFVIIAVLLLRREIDGEDDEDEDEEFDGDDDAGAGGDEEAETEEDTRESEARPSGYEPDTRSRREKPAELDESRKPAGHRRAVNGHSGGKTDSTGKDADAAGMVTPEELARFYHALNLEEEVRSPASSGTDSVSDDLDEDLEILDLEEETPDDVSRSGLEKDDDFDFLDL